MPIEDWEGEQRRVERARLEGLRVKVPEAAKATAEAADLFAQEQAAQKALDEVKPREVVKATWGSAPTRAPEWYMISTERASKMGGMITEKGDSKTVEVGIDYPKTGKRTRTGPWVSSTQGPSPNRG